jgi:LuxR family maltose regulon positive regulatory protein
MPAAHPTLVEQLTEREMDVLRLLAEGLTNPQISQRLIISAGTVKAHTAAIFRKLDVATRTQAVTVARRVGLLK